MANVSDKNPVAPAASTPALAANGATAVAGQSADAKPDKPKREVPMIGVSAKKDEYDDIKAALKLTLGGLDMDVGLGPFVLACALKHIRKEILKK